MLRFLTVFFSLVLTAGYGFSQSSVVRDGAPSSDATPPQTTTTPSAPGYTLRTSTRVVLTDVTITDAQGNPVRGLERSRFHIFDNNKPQELASFEEHEPQPSSPTARVVSAAANTFSNDYLLTAPAVSNVLFLDTTNLGIVDQMYLNQQLERFLPTLPAGQRLAIYARSGQYTLLLQNFTDDHAKLLAAIHRAIPHLPRPDAQDANDYQTIQQIILYLGQMPGRKNVLWFSGGSRFFIRPDATNLPVGLNLQPLYDALEASRIAIYPIDARGLMVSPPNNFFSQRMLMGDIAETTGGQAFTNNNGLAQITTHLLETDGSFYTLTYSPQDVRQNNKWHKVKVRVDGVSYNLSYRRGYFDDGNNTRVPTDRPRTLLRANGETTVLKDHDEPIIFNARVLPRSQSTVSAALVESHVNSVAPKKDEVAYAVHFTAPVEAFALKTVDGRPHVVLGAGTLVFNEDGRPVERVAQQFNITLDAAKLASTEHGLLDFDQEVNLPKGQEYLYLAVWDMATGRVGTIQVPLMVAK